MGHDLKSRVEGLIPVYQAKYISDVNIETKEHWKSMYFEKVGLEQKREILISILNTPLNHGLGAQRKIGFKIHLVNEFN